MLHPDYPNSCCFLSKTVQSCLSFAKVVWVHGSRFVLKRWRTWKKMHACVFGAPLSGPLSSSYTHPPLTHQACVCVTARERERERERQREMQPAHCFAFTVNNAITARSLVSLRFAFPSCLLPPRLLDFFFFICQEEDGLPVHLLTVSHIFPYEAIFCNDILILTIAREKREESAIIASLRWLNHGPAEQLAILSLLSLYLFLTQLHSQCRPTYIGGEKHTHIYCLIELNMILLKHNLQYSVRRDAHTFLLRFFSQREARPLVCIH